MCVSVLVVNPYQVLPNKILRPFNRPTGGELVSALPPERCCSYRLATLLPQSHTHMSAEQKENKGMRQDEEDKDEEALMDLTDSSPYSQVL